MNLDPAVYDNYFKTYVDKVKHDDVLLALKLEGESMSSFLEGVPAEKEEYRYAEGKWTIKELLVHLLDGERIMAYRALCISRGDKTRLPGFDENEYASHSNAKELTMGQILDSYNLQRLSTLSLFHSFTQEAMDKQGNANGLTVSPRILGYVIAGHAMHHREIIVERYLD